MTERHTVPMVPIVIGIGIISAPLIQRDHSQVPAPIPRIKRSRYSPFHPVRLRNGAGFFLVLSGFNPIVIVPMDRKYM